MPGKPWPKEEVELVRRLAPDYEALERLLPHRTRTQIRNRASKLGKAPTHRAFTNKESSLVRLLWPDVDAICERLPDLNRNSIRKHATTFLKLQPIMAASKRFTPAELDAVKDGLRFLPNRTAKSSIGLRHQLGIVLRPKWTEAEKATLRANPRGLIAGRTAQATKKARSAFQILIAKQPARSASGGEVILSAVQRAIPRTLPRQIQQEVLSDLTLAVLEGEIELANVVTAVSKVIKGVYKRYPVLGAPVSLDRPLFDDGGATLGDRITSDTFHF